MTGPKARLWGKAYDLQSAEGVRLFEAVEIALRRQRQESAPIQNALNEEPNKYGNPHIVHPRLGQGGFRVVVMESYGRRCAVTGEKTLPVLEAAHIRPIFG
jgi:putative restriction endonuclease